MFSHRYSDKELLSTLSDVRNDEDIPFLDDEESSAEVLINIPDETASSQPVQTSKPQLFLADEVLACIKLLEDARENIVINKEKLEEAKHYHLKLTSLQCFLNISLTSAAVVTDLHLNNIWKENLTAAANHGLQALGVLEKEQEIKKAELEALINNTVADNAGSEPVILSYIKQKYDVFTDWWYSKPITYVPVQMYDNYPHTSVWNDAIGYCTSWMKISETSVSEDRYEFINSKFPGFNGSDFCFLANSYTNAESDTHPFEDCDSMVKKICDFDKKLSSAMNATKFKPMLDLQDDIASREIKMNGLRERAWQQIPEMNIFATFALPGIALASLGYASYLLYKLKTAYAEYRKELDQADDLDKCLTDPFVATRVINLSSRLEISLKGIKLGDLIDKLTGHYKDIYDRRRIRHTVFYCLKEHGNQLDNLGLKDVVPGILEYAGLDAATQAPLGKKPSS